LAKVIWEKIHGSGPKAKPFEYVSDPPYPHDVQHRIPEVSKAKRVLGFEASTALSKMLDEVIPWIKRELEHGRI
jgi:nucleoside-diphosphate-sugar epimerase